MLSRLYAKWMYAWEYALTTRDSNRVERPLEWGFDHLKDFGGDEAAARVERGEVSALEAMIELNQRIVATPHEFFDYTTPTDFRIERHFPELYPTNVRPETLEQEREWKRKAEAGELRREPYLRFTSGVATPYLVSAAVQAVSRCAQAGGAGAGGLCGERQCGAHDCGVPAGGGGYSQLHGLA